MQKYAKNILLSDELGLVSTILFFTAKFQLNIYISLIT